MATTPAADLLRVRRRFRDLGTESFQALTDENLDEAVQQAVTRYSQDRPDDKVIELAGNGTAFYPITDLTGFVQGFSAVRQIEYPAEPIAAGYVPRILDRSSDWKLFDNGTATYLWLPRHTPSATEALRVMFTVPRVLSNASDTIVPTDKDAVLSLAAGYACTMLASQAAGNTEPLFELNSIDYKGAEYRYRTQASRWFDVYEAHIGAGNKRKVKPASIVRDFDSSGFPTSGPYFPNMGLPGWLLHRGRR